MYGKFALIVVYIVSMGWYLELMMLTLYGEKGGHAALAP
jgi:hypothetical protein